MVAPLVSIIIPFYNRITWLAEAVDSVLFQSFRDFEIILIDDGSCEKVNGIIDLTNKKIRYYRQSNRGPSLARNKGIKVAKGEYLVFLDSDDIFEYNKLEIQLKIMEKFPSSIMSHTSYITMDEKGTELQIVNSGQFSGDLYPGILMNCPIATPTVMIRKSSLGNFRFNDIIRIGEDIILWAQIAKKSEIVGIDLPLTRVRKHSYNAANDFSAHVETHKNINALIIKNDTDLSNNFKRLRDITFYREIGYQYLIQGERGKSIHYLLIAFRKSPFDINTVKKLLLTVMPKAKVVARIDRNSNLPINKMDCIL